MRSIKLPKVSIILPTYNGEKSLENTIQSVLRQSFADFELLIVDDGSLDRTENIVRSYSEKDPKIKYIKNTSNLGIQRSLNKGIDHAQGEYIARIDDDDIWIDPDKLKKQLNFLVENPEYVLVGSGAVLTDPSGKELSRYILPESDASIRARMLGKNCFAHAAVMFTKAAVLKVGGYGEGPDVRHVEDHDLWLRLGRVGKLYNLPEYVVSLTVSRESITAKHRVIQAWRMVKLCVRYKKRYPNFLKGIRFSLMRLCFFCIISMFPLPPALLYKIQSRVRSD